MLTLPTTHLAGSFKAMIAILLMGALFTSHHALADITLEEPLPDRINTELVMRINVDLGPSEDMGKGPDGHRVNYPITGGTFIGKGMQGVVVPGGADLSIMREDGTAILDALYRLRTDDNQIIIIHNQGIGRLNESGLEKQANGSTIAEMEADDIYTRTVPSFKTAHGEYDWLNDYIFVGAIDYPSDDQVIVSVYKVDGP